MNADCADTTRRENGRRNEPWPTEDDQNIDGVGSKCSDIAWMLQIKRMGTVQLDAEVAKDRLKIAIAAEVAGELWTRRDGQLRCATGRDEGLKQVGADPLTSGEGDPHGVSSRCLR
jgi:hypothetical protein